MTEKSKPNYAIVDIETTGGSANNHRITEIAIYIFDGEKVIDQFQTLINPERNIDHRIFSLTGISTEMVVNAPKFPVVAKKIVEMLEGNIFVAHNVGFDYGFIRKEFATLGYKLKLKRLCTVRLSRKILPGMLSYSLGKLCSSLNIEIENRHRAAGDAQATVELFKILQENDVDNHIEHSLNVKSREGLLPPNLPKAKFEEIPEECGVYYFHDSKGKVVYVGKAKNIKKRFLSHCGNVSSKAMAMKMEIHDVSWEITGNELVALLLESKEIKHTYPKYNSSQKRADDNYGAILYENRAGYLQFAIDRVKALNDEPLITFRKSQDAMNFFNKLMSSYELCGKYAGIQTGSGRCWNHQINECKGACIGEETTGSYNKRAKKAVDSFSIENQSFAIVENGKAKTDKSIVLVENGAYKGFGFFEPEFTSISTIEEVKELIELQKDNGDIRRIINGYLRSKGRKKVIRWEHQIENNSPQLFPMSYQVDTNQSMSQLSL